MLDWPFTPVAFRMPAPPPGKRPLSAERILATAAKTLHEDGVDAISIRKLASKLGVTPMAIYRHIESKDALLSALLDRFIREAEVLPASDLPWDEWLTQLGLRMWRAQVEEPAWIGLLGSVQIRSGGLGVLLDSLNHLRQAGFSAEDAAAAFFAVVHISVGASCLSLGLQQIRLDALVDPSDAARLNQLNREFGSVQKLLAAQHIERSLVLLMDGLRARHTA